MSLKINPKINDSVDPIRIRTRDPNQMLWRRKKCIRKLHSRYLFSKDRNLVHPFQKVLSWLRVRSQGGDFGVNEMVVIWSSVKSRGITFKDVNKNFKNVFQKMPPWSSLLNPNFLPESTSGTPESSITLKTDNTGFKALIESQWTQPPWITVKNTSINSFFQFNFKIPTTETTNFL